MGIVLDGAIQFALVDPHIAAIDEGVGEFRIELDRLAEIRRGAVELVLVVENEAAVVVEERKFRIDFDRFAQVLDGTVEVALAAPDAGTALVGGYFLGSSLITSL